jgi:hypothetical protein
MPKTGRNPSRPVFGMRMVVRGTPFGGAENRRKQAPQ